jgi:hypothetical protein
VRIHSYQPVSVLNNPILKSYTCLPLPDDSLTHAFPLLSPARYKGICALGSERFELRTAGLGCQVSTITFLTSIVTIFSTLFGVVILWLLSKCLKWVGVDLWARKGGFVLYPNDEESWKGELWVRRKEGWVKRLRRIRGDQKEFEVIEVGDGSTRDIVKRWWGGRSSKQSDLQSTERRPLLENS